MVEHDAQRGNPVHRKERVAHIPFCCGCLVKYLIVFEKQTWSVQNMSALAEQIFNRPFLIRSTSIGLSG